MPAMAFPRSDKDIAKVERHSGELFPTTLHLHLPANGAGLSGARPQLLGSVISLEMVAAAGTRARPQTDNLPALYRIARRMVDPPMPRVSANPMPSADQRLEQRAQPRRLDVKPLAMRGMWTEGSSA